jgi:hypothetical protein
MKTIGAIFTSKMTMGIVDNYFVVRKAMKILRMTGLVYE